MSKVTCDICGTVYPDNANACPICGYPRKGSEAEPESKSAVVSVNTAAAAAPRVKGGRFSNKNVKKRNTAPSSGSGKAPRKEKQEEKKDNKGLVIAVILLLIAVLLLGGYIIWRFIDGRDAYNNPATPSGSGSPSTSQTTLPPEPTETEPVDTGVSCVAMTISDAAVELTGIGRGWKLGITVTPEDTTDILTFTSSDENVVYVSPDGRLTAMGPGVATITITCGQVSKECTVYCNFEEETTPPETTKPTEPEETTKPTEPEPEKKGFQISHTDVTLFSEGESFTIKATYDGAAVSPASIVWASSDEKIATVSDNGKVTGVSGGTATITATYNGKTLKCIVRCKIEAKPTEPEYSDNNWTISHSDVTISVGESFTLKLTNNAGETAAVTWTVSKNGIVSLNGNKVTGSAAGTVNVTATIDGKTFTCIVRVK